MQKAKRTKAEKEYRRRAFWLCRFDLSCFLQFALKFGKNLRVRQLLVVDAVRGRGFGTESSFERFIVIMKIAFHERRGAFAFKGKDMCRDAVQKPAVVADDEDAAGKLQNRVFQGAQGID